MNIEQKKKLKIRYKTSALLSFASHVIRLHYNGRMLYCNSVVHNIMFMYITTLLSVVLLNHR